MYFMTNFSSSPLISSSWIYRSFCLANCYGERRRCPTAGSEGPSFLTRTLCRLAVWQLFICSLTQSSTGKPPQWHQGWHGVPEPHHMTDLTLVLLQHLSTSLSVEKKKLPGMSTKKTNQTKSNNKHTKKQHNKVQDYCTFCTCKKHSPKWSFYPTT